jgi:hypothetical protein
MNSSPEPSSFDWALGFAMVLFGLLVAYIVFGGNQ